MKETNTARVFINIGGEGVHYFHTNTTAPARKTFAVK